MFLRCSLKKLISLFSKKVISLLSLNQSERKTIEFLKVRCYLVFPVDIFELILQFLLYFLDSKLPMSLLVPASELEKKLSSCITVDSNYYHFWHKKILSASQCCIFFLFFELNITTNWTLFHVFRKWFSNLNSICF